MINEMSNGVRSQHFGVAVVVAGCARFLVCLSRAHSTSASLFSSKTALFSQGSLVLWYLVEHS
jgi:hypothetical protein